MLDRGQHLTVGGLVARQLVGDDYPRHIVQALEGLTEKSLGGVAVSSGLDQHVEHVAVLVDRPPQVMLGAVDFDEYLVEMPLVTGLWASAAQLVGVCLPELGAPPADRLVADHDTAFEHEFLDFAEAEREPEVQPHAVVDDLGRVAVAFVGRHRGGHATFSQFAAFNNVKVPSAPRRPGDKFRRSGESPRGCCVTEDNLTADEQIGLKQVLTSCRHLETTAGHVKSFAEMLTERLGAQLNSWISAVSADDLPQLRRFVRGLDTDHAAVRNGLTLPYSSGAVEGHVNRIKMLKRQMYGRAGFDLLRKRILLSD